MRKRVVVWGFMVVGLIIVVGIGVYIVLATPARVYLVN